MASTASEILGRIENDAVFQGFLDSGFDPAAFASKIVRADVGKANASAAAGGAGGSPVLQLQQGGDGVGSSNGGGVVASAESVSSQAEITLEVSELLACRVPPAASLRARVCSASAYLSVCLSVCLVCAPTYVAAGVTCITLCNFVNRV